jgi:hypothetical protein
VTLVERQLCYMILAKVANKETAAVGSALIRQAHKLPRELYPSLAWDRGKEFADHRRFTLATDIDVYFCDPQSPWQRGSAAPTKIPIACCASIYPTAPLSAFSKTSSTLSRGNSTKGPEKP